MRVIDDNGVNYLIQTEDGRTETRTKSSDLNKLLFGHNLHGLLDEGNEIWTSNQDGEPKVTIIPGEDDCYTLRIADWPDITLGEHKKTDLIDAMAEMYEDFDGESVRPLLELYNDIRENMVRSEILKKVADVISEKVVGQDNGWMINGHLLLSYEAEFYHPNTDSRERSGSTVVGAGSNTEAYSISIDEPDMSIQREITLDGIQYRLTDSEIEFLAKALWAIENTPDRG